MTEPARNDDRGRAGNGNAPQGEEYLRFLLAELDHRMKNCLASIQSVAMQTAFGRSSVAEFVDVFQGRLQAMANAHNLLSRSGWEGASLRALVETTLKPYQHDGVQFRGDPVVLDGKAAMTLGIAMHELATNAAKYGALSVPQARLDLRWRVQPGAEGRWLVLHWVESGGPPVVPPSRCGFGSRVIEKGLRHDLDGSAETDYAAEGLRCTLRIPERHFVLGQEGGGEVLRAPMRAAERRRSERCVLVVEDVMMIAMDVESVIGDIGWRVAGSASTLPEALAMAEERCFDCAVLDISLGNEKVYSLADRLAERGVPFLFLTGHDTRDVLPPRFEGRPVVAKPFEHAALKAALLALDDPHTGGGKQNLVSPEAAACQSATAPRL